MSLSIHGRWFRHKGRETFLRVVTYGPFPPKSQLKDTEELARIAGAGFNAVRLYEAPTREFLDLATRHRLLVIVTLPWHWDSLFTENDETLRLARQQWSLFLRRQGDHPALAACLIANEIRPDLARFMGPRRVRAALEELIDHCRAIAPHLLYAYANFPTTEYLEPRNADFTAFNIYLEEEDSLERYLQRLHNIAGDRPLLLTEFGLNTQGAHPGEEEKQEDRQRELLLAAYRLAREEACAGFTVYAWSDQWFNNQQVITDWSFGLTRRDGSAKPALAALTQAFSKQAPPPSPPPFLFSIAICTRNGGHRLRENLPHFENLSDENFELLIVDDGSTDDTFLTANTFLKNSKLASRVLAQAPSGLSAARNLAAREARGEWIVYIDDDARPHPQWLHYLRQAIARNPAARAAGGPNLPPPPRGWQNAIVTACLGNVSHILFTDTTAEHLPGCNLALHRKTLLELGGFDEQFHAAGDDVDICWRLLDNSFQLAFHPGACVFHDRRATFAGFLRQQRGYGEAEGLLYQKHPERFGVAGIRWEGFIYSGAPLTVASGAIIYHGPMGEAPYQMLALRQQPLRPLPGSYNCSLNRFTVRILEQLAQLQRKQTRKRFRGPNAQWRPAGEADDKGELTTRRDFSLPSGATRESLLHRLQEEGWTISHDTSHADLERGPYRLLLAVTPGRRDYHQLHLRLLHPPVPVDEILAQLTASLEKPLQKNL
ncbi:glycosyltransferase [Roseibacillus ishigakijimensis]|uniref:Glycosyltransferase n=1 Tax=Roseibacillus ishigakijimensis TaxID=454146 RepID=A0A934RMP0_9BACT|nr:glycosyltransferase [Roseibacillus ishigakijimensis]MBK1834209.1 glycosyltransferase [Roseibacillus ishigakijimensis]